MQKLLVITLASILSFSTFAADEKSLSGANTKMEQCAAAWQQLKAANRTDGLDYKTYSADCLKTEGVVPKVDTAGAVASAASGPKNKMKACADEWNALKAANNTQGKSYKTFSAECLKK